MIAHCLACDRAFPQNDELEHLRAGRRVAFDAQRGRLWIICDWCAHWSLVPMEARWEAVEELERRARARATVLGATERVSLLDLGGIRALRVGPALPREEAWWRYGPSLRQRQLRYAAITRAGGLVTGSLATIAVGGMVLLSPELALLKRRALRKAPGRAREAGANAAESFERWFRYGRIAWRGEASCMECGHALTTLRFRDRGMVLLQPDGTVHVRCTRCHGRDGWHVITGDDADRLIRRTLAFENIAGASDAQLSTAIDLIRTGDLDALRRKEPLGLRRAAREQLIALELTTTQHYEARLLGIEVAALEARWRSEEETAAIIDRELTPPERLDRPQRR